MMSHVSCGPFLKSDCPSFTYTEVFPNIVLIISYAFTPLLDLYPNPQNLKDSGMPCWTYFFTATFIPSLLSDCCPSKTDHHWTEPQEFGSCQIWTVNWVGNYWPAQFTNGLFCYQRGPWSCIFPVNEEHSLILIQSLLFHDSFRLLRVSMSCSLFMEQLHTRKSRKTIFLSFHKNSHKSHLWWSSVLEFLCLCRKTCDTILSTLFLDHPCFIFCC